MQAFLQHLFSAAAIVATATGCASAGELSAVEARVIELEKFEEHVRQLSERDTTRFQNLSNQIKDAANLRIPKAHATTPGVQTDQPLTIIVWEGGGSPVRMTSMPPAPQQRWGRR